MGWQRWEVLLVCKIHRLLTGASATSTAAPAASLEATSTATAASLRATSTTTAASLKATSTATAASLEATSTATAASAAAALLAIASRIILHLQDLVNGHLLVAFLLVILVLLGIRSSSRLG